MEPLALPKGDEFLLFDDDPFLVLLLFPSSVVGDADGLLFEFDDEFVVCC